MLKPNRVQMNVYPLTTQKLGNNTYYYNYDVQEVEVELEDGTIEILYNYIQVLLYGLPNYKDCVQAIVRSFLTIDEEFDLINSYNSYIQELTTDSSIVNDYKEYLNLLKEIKTRVKEDFGIL